jgi:NAD(P)-dependent dehydrogenase (short-subunit alcohol dehydrogenase family)
MMDANEVLMSERNKVALVTGAARRIGRAIAQRLAREGYDIALHVSERSRSDGEALAEIIRASGRHASVLTADLSNASAVGDLVARATATGDVTLLVNNASVFEADRAGVFDGALWDRHFAVNVRAPAQLSAAFVGALPSNLEGCIVNIVDQRVWRLNPNFFSYTLSKAALWTATQTMAQAFAPRVRVNAVGPGPTLANHMQDGSAFEREASAVPLARGIDPSEIADAVAYLASARSVTGQMIAVDGGQHLAWRTPDVEC